MDGLRRVDGSGVALWSDLPAETLRPTADTLTDLRPAWDRLFDAVPADDGRVRGFVMSDVEPFAARGLLDGIRIPSAGHGRQIGREFFVRYTTAHAGWRHITRHEAFHAHTIGLHGVDGADWFLEGTAELFALYRYAPAGDVSVGVVPEADGTCPGWNRLDRLRRDVASGLVPTVAEIVRWTTADFERSDDRLYVWSWAFCLFLDGDPQTRGRFRGLFASRSAEDFDERFMSAVGPDLAAFDRTWPAFAATIDYGLDPAAVSIGLVAGEPVGDDQRVVDLQTDRGWQGTGVRVTAGETLRIDAPGRFTLADLPKPWVSTADGVSIRYHLGKPLGRLVAAVDDGSPTGFLDVIDVGSAADVNFVRGGDLYLRVNDVWNELSDNRATLEVTIRKPEP
ncbi:MAG: hypothetical protein AAF532_06510 [Planctomycetota bacterium]